MEAPEPDEPAAPATVPAVLPVYVTIGESDPQQIGTISVDLVLTGEGEAAGSRAVVTDGGSASGQVAELLEAAAADLRGQAGRATAVDGETVDG